jgi:hypothetical protein
MDRRRNMYAAADSTSALSGTAQYNQDKTPTYLKNSCDGLDGSGAQARSPGVLIRLQGGPVRDYADQQARKGT